MTKMGDCVFQRCTSYFLATLFKMWHLWIICMSFFFRLFFIIWRALTTFRALLSFRTLDVSSPWSRQSRWRGKKQQKRTHKQTATKQLLTCRLRFLHCHQTCGSPLQQTAVCWVMEKACALPCWNCDRQTRFRRDDVTAFMKAWLAEREASSPIFFFFFWFLETLLVYKVFIGCQ